jgi:hypothetical protein
MRPDVLRLLAVAAVAAPLALGACKRAETPAPEAAPKPPPAPAARAASQPQAAPPAAAPFRVTSIEIGNAIGDDKRVTTPTATLAPGDTIYASVASDGSAPSMKLTARWTFEDGQQVEEKSQDIRPDGPAVSEFHVAMPGGWPVGRYQVEILADGRPVGTREFEVR